MTIALPRFSLRTLAIVVTLVCAYFGAWEATRKYGCERIRYDSSDGYRFAEDEAFSPMPFVVRSRRYFSVDDNGRWRDGFEDRYHLWCRSTWALPYVMDEYDDGEVRVWRPSNY